MNIMDKIEKMQCKQSVTEFNVGDTVKVHTKIIEGENERVQVFSGVVIAKKHHGIRETFTVRRVSFGHGVEKIFPLNSPRVEKIEVERKGHVRRAKLYYLRSKIGKSAKVKEQKFIAAGLEAAIVSPAAEAPAAV
jgi:large subunit ribosomal protein L19